MKGDMELEVPVKIVIALIVVMVVVSFIFLVSRSVKSRLSRDDRREEVFTVSKDVFSSDDLSRYSSLCYEKAKQRELEYITCFLLRGDMSMIDFSSREDVDCDDNGKGFLIVRYLPDRGVVFEC